MKKKYIFIFLVNLVPYLILFITFMVAYSDIFNSTGIKLGDISIITFFLIFVFNIYYIPKIIILKMPTPLLLESRVIGIAISIGLNVILFISIWYTAVQIDSIARGF
jgi:hypothetical protein